MVDIQSFALSLPSFIERSYFITPGVVSVVFKVIWSIFTFLVVTLLVQYGLASIGIKEKENKQKTIWQMQCDYTKVQSVSNGRWGGMLLNLPSTRVIIGFLFWIFIYAFELLFSLSIDNSQMTIYNGTNCVGRVDNLTAMTTTMWFVDASNSGYYPAKNSTIIRQLLNQKRAGNFALLGDGIFSVSSSDALYKKNQIINVARSGYNCNNNSTLHLKQTAHGSIYKLLPSGDFQDTNFSTPTYKNITTEDVGNLVSGYLNLKNVISFNTPANSTIVDNKQIYLLLISNPTNSFIDINDAVYNSSVFLTECTLFYEYGQVTIIEDGYLNETNIGDSYVKVSDSTLDAEFVNSNIDTFVYKNKYFLSTIDFPDIFLNTDYNKTYLDTLKIANNIVSAHLLCGLDENADLCTYNQEQIPVYISVIGTKMSFGYILVGVLFTVLSILILSAFAIAMFTKEERKKWLLYSIDWRFTGYISNGDNMDQKEFKKYAKNNYADDSNISKAIFEVSEDERSHSDSLLRKE